MNFRKHLTSNTIQESKKLLISMVPIFFFGCQEAEKETGNLPNILLIVSEDHSPHLSCYGDKIIKTPNLDKLADEGILFRNAYVTQTTCSPSRSSILTGLHVYQNGHLGTATHGYHLVGEVENIYQILKDAGYRTGMIGKLHLNPKSSFPIDYHPITASNYDKQALYRYSEYADSFMRSSEDPFFLMVNFPDAHGPWQDQVEGKPVNPISADDVVTFPHIGMDNERLRGITANYYNCILRMDECVGELMTKLAGSGLKENTLVIYLSDHGDQMGRGKVYLYETGVKVPFLVTWQGKIKQGIKSEALISTIDIVPTILEAVGLSILENLPGKSLIPLFKKPDINFRKNLITERNCEARQFHFPQRAIRDKRYKLIYTLLEDRGDPAAIFFANHPDLYVGTPKTDELEKANDSIRRMYHIFQYPPKIQLYDLQNDPWEFNDISNDPDYFTVKKDLLNALFDYQEKTNDPLRFPEKLHELTMEHDSVAGLSKHEPWRYPKYLYGINY